MFRYLFVVFLLLITTHAQNTCKYGFNGQYCDECGRQFREPNLKIVGGIDAVPHSWPFVVLLQSPINPRYTCGGVLIDRDTVVTAAHCLIYPNPQDYTIVLGLQDISQMKEPSVVNITAKRVIQHPKYDTWTSSNDIGVIKLEKEAVLNEYIQPTCLPDKSKNYFVSNRTVYAVGWGLTNPDVNQRSNILQNVNLNLVNFKTCYDYYKKNYDLILDSNTQICAGYLPGGKDTCQGDSGGPVFLKDTVNGKQKFVWYGITSQGDGCAKPKVPGIYTKVSAYLDWVYSFNTLTTLNPTTRSTTSRRTTTRRTTKRK